MTAVIKQFQTTEAFTEDTIVNTTRKVRIIFSIDSMNSTIAAALIKEQLDIQAKEAHLSFYTFEFIEIGHLGITDHADAYLWLGMTPVEEAFNVTKEPLFQIATHVASTSVLNEKGHEPSVYDELLLNYFTDLDNTYVRMDENSVGLSEEELDNKVILGPITNSLSEFSYLVPELKMEVSDKTMVRLSKIQNDIQMFYSKSASSLQVVDSWALMHESLAILGLPHDQGALSLNADVRSNAYFDAYRKVRKNFEEHREVHHIMIKSKLIPVFFSRVATDFWIVRRVVTLVSMYYHNTRISGFGLYITTNLPAWATKLSHRDGRSSGR